MKVHYFRLIFILTLSGNALLAQETKTVTFKGNPASSISSGAIVPSNTKLFYSSGSVSPIFDTTASASYRTKVGTTQQQGVAILNKLKADLAIEGLGMKDVFFMRVYVAPHKETGKLDFQGWFDAYAQFFGTKENPVKPARSTIGVMQLVNPDKFLEIEIVAIYPK
jgi:enamine deaminase RidA (YjgF/YER057c/UK114 family)